MSAPVNGNQRHWHGLPNCNIGKCTRQDEFNSGWRHGNQSRTHIAIGNDRNGVLQMAASQGHTSFSCVGCKIVTRDRNDDKFGGRACQSALQCSFWHLLLISCRCSNGSCDQVVLSKRSCYANVAVRKNGRTTNGGG